MNVRDKFKKSLLVWFYFWKEIGINVIFLIYIFSLQYVMGFDNVWFLFLTIILGCSVVYLLWEKLRRFKGF